MRITSEQIAKLANVSRSTVSRVINNYSNVPEETRQRVTEVIEKYGYEPNTFARVLAGKDNMEIALCISDYNLSGKRWKGMDSPYFMRLIAELISQSKTFGYMISIFVVSEHSDYAKIENLFLNRAICGGIFVGFEFQMDKLNDMIGKGFNMVVLDPEEHMKEADNVKGIFSENEEAAYIATNYLLKKGHRHIAHISGDDRLSGRERLNGYLRAMREAGIQESELYLEHGDFNRDKAYEAALNLMKKGNVTAIFSANDLMAISAMRAVESLGLRVPEDIGIMGCDYVSIYADLGIYLTTVEISIKEIANTAVRAVLDIEKRKKIVCKARLRNGNTA